MRKVERKAEEEWNGTITSRNSWSDDIICGAGGGMVSRLRGNSGKRNMNSMCSDKT